MRIILISILSFGVLVKSAASNFSDSLRDQNIKRYPGYFYIWPVIQQHSTSFDIANQSKANPKLTFRPNGNYNVGIGMYIFKVSFEAALSVSPDSEKQKIYGHSSSSDYQTNILGKHWGINAFAQNYKGFYLSDSDKPTPSIYPQRPDIAVWNTGVNGIYFFNKSKFSVRAAYNFAERQLKSRGSFLLSGTVNTFSLRADSAIYGSSYEPTYGVNADFRKLDYTTISVAPGYTHTFVIKHFFMNGSLSIGPAQHWVYYQSAAISKHEITVNNFIDLRLAIGYNSDRFFSGINFVAQSRNIKFEQIQFTSTSSTFRMVIGYRFHEFGVLKKSAWDLLPFKKGRPKKSKI